MMNPIYKPKGAAGEYADLALNIYTGCTNGCEYCYAPGVLRKTREEFGANVQMRKGLLEALEKQLAGSSYEGKTVHLCFTCDPYPFGIDTKPTREVIRRLKDAGCHIQILTKNPDMSYRDWSLLDGCDWIGTTISGDETKEPNAAINSIRLRYLEFAKARGFKTWVSCEPVLDQEFIYNVIRYHDYIDLYKVGKLNYHPSDIDWAKFGREVQRLCEEHERTCILKESLLKEMGRA